MRVIAGWNLQFTTCSKPAVHNLQQVCSSQLGASLQFATCSKSAVRNLQQVCSSQLAASLLTTCSRLVVIKPEQAMRTHPDIGLMIATCSKSAADLLQLARFWLCKQISYVYTRKNEQLDQCCQQLVAMLFSTTCYNVVLHPINNCCQQALFKVVRTTCSRLTNQQGVNNVVETAQNNVITVLLNAWQINKAWTTLLEQLRSTWYHSSFIWSTTLLFQQCW